MIGSPRPWEILLLACLTALSPPLALAAPVSIGSISTEPATEIRKFLPFATYLARELRSEGFGQEKVVVAKGIPEMAALMREGR